MEIVVLKVFRDKANAERIFSPGDVTVVDEFRAKDLILRGLAVPLKREPPKTPEPPVTEIDLSRHHAKVIADVRNFTDAVKLNGYLVAETESENVRESVVEALKKRILELEGA